MPLYESPSSALEPEVSIVLSERFRSFLIAGVYDEMKTLLKEEYKKNGLKGFPLLIITIEKWEGLKHLMEAIYEILGLGYYQYKLVLNNAEEMGRSKSELKDHMKALLFLETHSPGSTRRICNQKGLFFVENYDLQNLIAIQYLEGPPKEPINLHLAFPCVPGGGGTGSRPEAADLEVSGKRHRPPTNGGVTIRNSAMPYFDVVEVRDVEEVLERIEGYERRVLNLIVDAHGDDEGMECSKDWVIDADSVGDAPQEQIWNLVRDDGRLILYSCGVGRGSLPIRLSERVEAPVFSSTADVLAVTVEEDTVQFWDKKRGKYYPIPVVGHKKGMELQRG